MHNALRLYFRREVIIRPQVKTENLCSIQFLLMSNQYRQTLFADTKKSLSITDRDFHLRYKKVLGLRTSAFLLSSLVVLRYSQNNSHSSNPFQLLA